MVLLYERLAASQRHFEPYQKLPRSYAARRPTLMGLAHRRIPDRDGKRMELELEFELEEGAGRVAGCLDVPVRSWGKIAAALCVKLADHGVRQWLELRTSVSVPSWSSRSSCSLLPFSQPRPSFCS